MQLPYIEEQYGLTLTMAYALRDMASLLWKDWPMGMEVVGHDATGNFSFRGVCPHSECRRASVFVKVQTTATGPLSNSRDGYIFRWVAVLQCQGCRKYILGIAQAVQNSMAYIYEEHYPMGSPDDAVAAEIPAPISEDFKEALRCLWVDAYNATAEMCRRAIESSCVDLGAPQTLKILEDKIDWLEQQRIITPFLRDVAHKIRLGGNRAAHPPDVPIVLPVVGSDLPKPDEESAPVIKITKEHAEAIVTFTREFFHHVYVVPKQMDKYDFSRPKAAKP